MNSEAGTVTRATPYRQALFEHMEREHGLTLLDSELDEIERVVCRQPALAGAI